MAMESRTSFHRAVISDFAKDLEPQSIIALTKNKVNFILGLSTKQTPLTSLAAEFSLIPPPPGTPLISYFPKRDEPPSLIPISPSEVDISNKILSKDISPIWFSGAPHALGNNPLLVPILHAPLESYGSEVDGGTADAIVEAAEKGGEGLWAGSQLGVVTGLQTLDGARVTWLGGVDMLTNGYIQKETPRLVVFVIGSSSDLTVPFRGAQSGNAQLARDIVAWTFQENLVLRIDKVEHHKVNATEPSEQYTVNDQLVSYLYMIFERPCRPINRCSAYIFRNSIQRKAIGPLALAAKTCNSNSQCWTPTFAPRFTLSQASQGNIPLHSAHLTGTAFSNL
jgi:oligosaccharyltransferase complex subunit beta